MEARQIQCDNLGMSRDTAISALGKDKSGTTNFAFENFNIRILANNDNTALAATNEKSTKAELTGINAIQGVFLGACKLNKYLVVFVKDPNPRNAALPDSIYRIHFDGTNLVKILLYNGNLNFSLGHPIEAVGYYESEEVQKVYWVDGYNSNRFINIVDVAYTIGGTDYYRKEVEDIAFPDGTIHALANAAGTVVYYYYTSGTTTIVWAASDVTNARGSVSNVAGLRATIGTTYSMTISGQPLYIGKINPFDFQGSISKVPVAKITKNYNEAGEFQAGVMQYFFSYYNKYGVETCLIWNSDLQYISMQDRGAKQDENVACGFDFSIDTASLDFNYQFLRIYSCYRSSINTVAGARLVAEIELSGIDPSTTSQLGFTDLGTAGETVNAADLKYIGGQNIIASTLDYKQDTLFLGNLKTPSALFNTCSPRINGITSGTTKTTIDIVEDTTAATPVSVQIYECPGISWIYKLVSDHQPEGVYSYKSQLNNSQEEIAGFKWRELYRFGIQFMTPTGEWTNAQWIGDKYCDIPPMNFAKREMVIYDPKTQKDIEVTEFEADGLIPNKLSDGSTNHSYRPATPDSDGIYTLLNYNGQSGFHPAIKYEADGYYMATATVDLTKIFDTNNLREMSAKYIGYRLLMADMDISNRRIIEQGIINPTMFNYSDRHYNRPYAIPSWIFRPRKSSIVNRHFDTLPNQTDSNAELQGIMERKLPAFDEQAANEGSYNAYMFVIAANDGGCYMQWKLIYYNSAHKVPTTDASGNKTAFGQWLDSKGFDYQTSTDRKLANLAYLSEVQEGVLDGSKVQIEGMFGDDYMVVSSHRIKKAEGVGKWEKVAGSFLDTLVNDIKTKKDPSGLELPMVFSSAMVPGGGLLRDIAYLKGDIALILAVIALVIAAVAAAVASVFTAGAAAAAAGVACAAIASLVGSVSLTVGTVCAMLTPIVACAAVAGAAGAAALAQNMDKFGATDRKMIAKGFFPVNTNHGLTGDNNRKHTGGKISALFKTFFNTTPYNENHVKLKDDPDIPFVMAASTGASIGMDFNAYVSGGALTFADAEDLDLRHKANLFCVDESIVTMNAPDVEDTFNAIENSDAYNLELVGMVPVHSAYGMYDLQCTQGLASAAEVMRNHFVVPKSVPTTDVLGLVNGDFYQDTDITEATLVGVMKQDSNGNWIFDKTPQTVPSVALYRQWMWNRETSIGMWMPGIPLLDALGEKVLIPPSQPTHKLFANMRYSFNTEYRNPFRMIIDTPRSCLDEQVMLKSFKRAGDTKFYYENVNTIATTDTVYTLVKNRTDYPQNIEKDKKIIPLKTIASLRDPIQIKYKETPHILIPIQDHDGVTALLPYTVDEEPVTPYSLYGEGSRNEVQLLDKSGNVVKDADGNPKIRTLLNNVILEGVRTTTPEGATFRVISTADMGDTASDIVATIMTKASVTFPADHDWVTLSSTKAKTALIAAFNYELYHNFDALYTTTNVPGYTNVQSKTLFELIARESLKEMGAHNALFRTVRTLDTSTIYNYYINSNGIALYELEIGITASICQTPTAWPTVRIRQIIGSNNVSGKLGYADKVLVQSYPVKGDTPTKTATSNDKYIGYLDKVTTPTVIQFRSDLQGRFNCSVFSLHIDAQAYQLTSVVNITDAETYYLIKGVQPDNNNKFDVEYPNNIANYYDTLESFQSWDQTQLSWDTDGYPYLFMGELVKKVFDYNTWMGGTQKYALKQLHWNVASPITTLTKGIGYNKILNTWGDTYYQRWDCEKTFPTTEDDKNSIVEVLSFMLESHLNLDGRSDVNRGISNLLNIRPYNTMFNPVYGQKDNFFSYSILDEKFEKSTFESDIAWSLTKNNMSDVDSWTSIMAVNQMSMEGRLGAVRKILNVGDTLIVFQDTGLSMIKYNEETALQTSAGLPLQLGNTGKVSGYRIVSDVIGCHNKFSINKNSAGVFFVDDYNKAFMQYTQNGGIKDVGQEAAFSEWFKENISGSIWTPRSRDAFRTSYDEVTHDLYLINGPVSEEFRSVCLVYNTLLQKFTSFMSYVDTPIITRLNSDNGKSGAFAVRQNTNSVDAWQLFAGNGYNNIYGNPVPYSMEYRINPDPTHDSIFTNYQFTADWLEPNHAADKQYGFGSQSFLTPGRNPSSTVARRFVTFDTVEAWNEYQYGKKAVPTARVGRFPIKSKFRIWRGDIPREGENIGVKRFMPDRMRNPWIHLRFEKLASADDSKMIFHNLVVNYYNQYGRF